jgi:hypothetical protein
LNINQFVTLNFNRSGENFKSKIIKGKVDENSTLNSAIDFPSIEITPTNINSFPG